LPLSPVAGQVSPNSLIPQESAASTPIKSWIRSKLVYSGCIHFFIKRSTLFNEKIVHMNIKN
jgi:hypothetical protein